MHGIETGGNTELFVLPGQADGSFGAAVNTTLTGVGRSGNVSIMESSYVGDITGDGLADWVHALEAGGSTTYYVARGTVTGAFLDPVETVFVGIGRAGSDSLFEASFIGARPSPGYTHFIGLFGDGFETGDALRWEKLVIQ